MGKGTIGPLRGPEAAENAARDPRIIKDRAAAILNGSGIVIVASLEGGQCSTGGRTPRGSILEGETYLHRHLVVGELPLLDVAAGADDLEPAHVAHGLGGPRDGVLNRLVDPALGRTGQLDGLVDVLAHQSSRRKSNLIDGDSLRAS